MKKFNKQNLKGGASMRLEFISETKKGSKKAALRKQNQKERKHRNNTMSYLMDLD